MEYASATAKDEEFRLMIPSVDSGCGRALKRDSAQSQPSFVFANRPSLWDVSSRNREPRP